MQEYKGLLFTFFLFTIACREFEYGLGTASRFGAYI